MVLRDDNLTFESDKVALIRHLTTLSLCFLACLMLPSCWNGDKEQEALRKGLVVINVLDKKLYDDCRIKGSIHVPFEELEQFAQKRLSKDAEIVLYCSNYFCSSSGFGCKKLQELGFKNVRAYEGGTAEWYQLGLPVEGKCTEAYLTKQIEKAPFQDEDLATITAQELIEKIKVSYSIT